MAGDTKIFQPSKLHPYIQDIILHFPFYASEFDPKAYANWEIMVDKEFRKYDLFLKSKM
jgi:hypothetical protein